MMVHAGQLAPGFEARTYQGEPLSLVQFRGKKVWLGFYRWASCPMCSLRIREVMERYPEFEAEGIQPIVVFQSPPGNIERSVGDQQLPFPVIADPDLRLYATYGVHARWSAMFRLRVFVRALRAVLQGFFSLRIDGPMAMVPADFLVDPEGVVWKAYYGGAISDHIPFDDVRAFAADRCLDLPEGGLA